MTRLTLTNIFAAALLGAALTAWAGGPAHAPAGHAQSASPRLPAVTRVPFELADRIIVVQAEVNGMAGNYLVDSGAPVMVLNEARFAPGALDTKPMNHASPSGAGGAMENVRAVRGLALAWQGIRIEGLTGMVTDLSHLERNLGGIEIQGLIGFDVLERFQVHFDYAVRTLTLLTLDEDGAPVVESELPLPAQVVPFELAGHVPVLPVSVAGLDLRMGLDSGAAGAMIFTRWQDALRGKYEFLARDELHGADRNVQMGDVVRIPDMRLADLSYPDMTFRFNDIAGHGGRQPPFDGLLGYEFLKTRPTAINFRSAQLMVWD